MITSDKLIDRFLNGEQIESLLDEVTKTADIAKYPKPMCLVRKTRKDKNKKESSENG